MTSITKWDGILAEGFAPVQEKSTPRYQAPRQIRVFTSNVMAGLLQTEAYTTALLHTIAAFSGTPDDAEAGAAKRAERSLVIRDESKDIRIVLDEAVLYRRIGGAQVMAEQLGHVLEAMELPAVRLGIIPRSSDWSDIWPLEAFYLFDDEQVQVELLTQFVEVTDAEQVSDYGRAFELLSGMACFDAEARELVENAARAVRS